MMLFSHWLFWLKNCRFSTNSCQGFIVSLTQKTFCPKDFILNLAETLKGNFRTKWVKGTKKISHSVAVSRRCSVKKVLLKISQNSQENTCARVSFLIKLKAPPKTLLNMKLCHRRFSANFGTFLRIPFLWNTSGGCSYSLLSLGIFFLLNKTLIKAAIKTLTLVRTTSLEKLHALLCFRWA